MSCRCNFQRNASWATIDVLTRYLRSQSLYLELAARRLLSQQVFEQLQPELQSDGMNKTCVLPLPVKAQLTWPTVASDFKVWKKESANLRRKCSDFSALTQNWKKHSNCQTFDFHVLEKAVIRNVNESSECPTCYGSMLFLPVDRTSRWHAKNPENSWTPSFANLGRQIFIEKNTSVREKSTNTLCPPAVARSTSANYYCCRTPRNLQHPTSPAIYYLVRDATGVRQHKH